MSKTMSGPMQVVFLSLLGLVFAGIGGGMVFIKGLPEVLHAKQSESWPTTSGVVTMSKVETKRGSKGGTTYRARVLYQYTVDGEKLTGDRVWFGDDISTSGGKTAQQTVRDFPVGKKVKVYYDPEDPLETCLMPGTFYSTYFLLVFGGIFLLIGLAILIYPAMKLFALIYAFFIPTGNTFANDDERFTNGDSNSHEDYPSTIYDEDDSFDIQ